MRQEGAKRVIREEDFALLQSCASEFNICLERGQIEKFYLYTKELLEWNKGINLVSFKTVKELIVCHYLDSLIPSTFIEEGGGLMDVGAGWGCPGIPLKILMPHNELVLVEAMRKKAAFLRNSVIKLCLEHVEVFHGRSEDICFRRKYERRIDTIITRAAISTRSILEVGRAVMSPKGRIILMKGRINEEDKREIGDFVRDGKRTMEMVYYRLPFIKHQRVLIIIF
ncbi:MAG: 16S rRNA (guanine(527)-N(7))-methyltransferase RsmG [Rubrivivax sp.]|nr:16S rRNA (guanine(527)-N(7))-methyltransferase RsmG [Rubrivivax sp.]